LHCDSPIKNSDLDGIAAYSENCILKLPGGAYTESQSSLVVTPYLVADSTLVGNPISVNVGKQGIPLLQLKSKEGSNTNEYASLKSMNSKSPWTTPASLHIEGSVCGNAVSSDLAGVGHECDVNRGGTPLGNLELKLCTAPTNAGDFESTRTIKSCSTTLTGSDGKFQFDSVVSKVGSDGGLKWAVDGNFQGLSLRNPRMDSSISHAFVSVTFLPSKPIPPLTPAQIASNKKALYNYGAKLIGAYTKTQLTSIGFLGFFLPGKNYLSRTSAQDFCSQLPTVIVGLAQQVGMPANSNFIAGCTAAAVKIHVFNPSF
jgi:hypothetical protein